MGFITTTDEHIASGGTISGNLTIDADLTVSGSTAITTNEVIQGTSIIDVTNTEALLIRKNSDGGDVFVVDTTNTKVKVKNFLQVGYPSSTGSDNSALYLDKGSSGSSQLFFSRSDGADVDWKMYTDGDESLLIEGVRAGEDLIIKTVPSGGSATEAMRITSAGLVGIGTGANVDELLHVQNDSNNAVIKIEAGSSGNGARLQMISATNDTAEFYLGDSGDSNIGRITYNHTSNYLAIHTNDAERMRIDSTGNVGIGTASPNTRLTLNGSSGDGWLNGLELQVSGTAIGRIIGDGDGMKFRTVVSGDHYYFRNSGNTTNMIIQDGGNVGIGTGANVDTKFHVQDDASNCVLKIEASASNTGARIQLISAANDTGDINFGDDADTNDGRITYNHTGRYMAFHAADASRFKIDANSRISLSNTDTGTSSTVFGYKAGMPGHANALGNIFIGQEAGENVGSSDTDGNVMIGYRAGRGTFTDATDHNVGIGYTALNVLTSGHGNVAMGSGAGIAIQDAESNVAIGRNALGQVVSSNQNIALGFNSGYGLTTGANNTVIGAEALYNSADIDRAVVIGKNAIYAGNATAGADGTIAIGYDAARALTSGGQNIAIGYEALHDCTTGRRNTVIGYQAADTLTAGSDDNTAVGYAALGAGNHDTTHQNSCFGYGAGDTITTGSNNTCLGSQANVSASGAVGQIAIGQAVTCTADNTATLGIGSNTASLGLDGSDTSWAAASSDKRLKENIETSSAGLDVINDLRPVTYNWKKAKDVDNGMPQYKDSEEPVLGLEYGETLHGFIAQEVKEVVDNHSSLKEGFKMWKLKDDGTQTVADGNLIPILVKAVQELTAKVEELEKK